MTWHIHKEGRSNRPQNVFNNITEKTQLSLEQWDKLLVSWIGQKKEFSNWLSQKTKSHKVTALFTSTDVERLALRTARSAQTTQELSVGASALGLSRHKLMAAGTA